MPHQRSTRILGTLKKKTQHSHDVLSKRMVLFCCLLMFRTVFGEEELCQLHTQGTLTVASWRNLAFAKVDFGSGIGRQRGRRPPGKTCRRPMSMRPPITVEPSPCDLQFNIYVSQILRYFLRTLCLVIVIGSRVENAVKLLAVHYIAQRLETFPFVNSKFL